MAGVAAPTVSKERIMNSNTGTANVKNISTGVKPAAIWARVSTLDQAETSLPGQVSRCKEKLELAGYSAIQTFQVDWSSMDLYNCPEFQELMGLIRNKEIKALAVYDRDRLQAKGLQRLVFLADMEENGVELIVCYGPPILEGPEGQITEMVLAVGKERQVLRARQGAKDGLRDRIKSGKPAEYHRLYGYNWDKKRNRLVPNGDWPNLKLMFDMLLDGSTYRDIQKEFKQRGILTPKGNDDWNTGVISQMVHNPTYAGRYYGLKRVAVEPDQARRKGKTYGNSSARTAPLDEAFWVKEIRVVNPPITWAQRGYILDQIGKRQKLASRNAKREYMMRGRIFCEEHHGKKDEPLVYQGAARRGTYYYRCYVGGCRSPYIDGPWADTWVKALVTGFFSLNNEQFFNLFLSKETRQKNRGTLVKELNKLGKEHERLVNNAAQLEDERINGRYEKDIETYERLNSLYQTRRKGVKDRQEDILRELNQLENNENVVDSFIQVKSKFMERLNDSLPENRAPELISPTEVRNPLTDREWQQLLSALGFEIHIHNTETAKKAATEVLNITKKTTRKGEAETILVEIRWALPVVTDKKAQGLVRDIALVEPNLS